MKRTLAVALLAIFLTSCVDPSPRLELSLEPNWQSLKESITYGVLANISLGSFSLPNIPTTATPVDRITVERVLDGEMDGIDADVSSRIQTVSVEVESEKEDLMATAKSELRMWNLSKIEARSYELAGMLNCEQPFDKVTIQVDPSLSAGLSRVKLDGTHAILFVPTNVSDDTYTIAYITALLSWASRGLKLDLSKIETFCKKHNSPLAAMEQLLVDLAFAMSTWTQGELEPPMRTYLLRSSLRFGHVFTPQLSTWAGNFFQFTGMKLADLIPYAVEDASNEHYEKVYDQLTNPARLGLSLKEKPGGLVVSGVSVGGNAEQAGVLTNDVLISVFATNVGTFVELENKLWDLDPNSIVMLKVSRDRMMGSKGALAIEDDPADAKRFFCTFQYPLVQASKLPRGVY